MHPTFSTGPATVATAFGTQQVVKNRAVDYQGRGDQTGVLLRCPESWRHWSPSNWALADADAVGGKARRRGVARRYIRLGSTEAQATPASTLCGGSCGIQ